MSFSFTPLEQCLIRLALDPAAAEGEIQNCGSKLMLLLRRRGVDPEEILQYSIESTSPKTFVHSELRMPFGKYKDLRLREIDPDYLRWVCRSCGATHPDLVRAVGRYLKEVYERSE